MQITKNSSGNTGRGPSEWFTGVVFIDPVAAPSNGSKVSASSVHFTPGARTAWHTHPHGQTIWVTEGVGLCQRRVGPIEVIRPGDRVFFEPGEEHWHGATSSRFMTHLAMLQVDEAGNAATWGDQVTDEEYAATPAIAPESDSTTTAENMSSSRSATRAMVSVVYGPADGAKGLRTIVPS